MSGVVPQPASAWDCQVSTRHSQDAQPLQTLAEREAALADAEQTTRQPAAQLEERRRQTQELVAQAQQQQDLQQVRLSMCCL